MLKFLLKRLLSMIPLLLGITLMVFVLMSLAPGDILSEARSSRDVSPEVIQALEKQFGLDRPWYVQYGRWLKSVATLDFGESWAYKVPVRDLLVQRMPATLILSLSSLLFAWCVAIPLGVLAAIYKDSIFDRIASGLAYAALSLPEFFLAILAVYVAALTGWLPTGGARAIESEFLPLGMQVADYVRHLILPTLVLGLGGVAGMMRVMRANFLDYMRAEFVNTARAKGLPEGRVMFVHVLRNAINPFITSLGFAMSGLLSGSVIVERVMNYPGLGLLIYDSILRKDQYVVMAAVVMGCVMLMLGNLLADILLALSDPRIRLGERVGTPVRLRRAGWWVLGGGLTVLLLTWGWELVRGWKTLWMGLGLAVVVLFGVLCVGLIGYVVWVMARRLWRPFLRRPLGVLSLGMLLCLYVAAGLAPWLAPYAPQVANLEKTFHPPTALFWKEGRVWVREYAMVDRGSAVYQAVEGGGIPLRWFADGKLFSLDTQDNAARVYLLGSDSTGRDIFSRLLYGGRVSLSIGLIGISITLVMGFVVGGLSGYFGGVFDFCSMRLVEFLMAVPGLYLLLSLRSAFAAHVEPAQMYLLIVVILSMIGWAGKARVIRGMTLSLRNRPFVLAAECLGQSAPKILVKHILPNMASYLLVAATLSIPAYILGEAALSFLGLGIQEPSASWGLMLKQSQEDMKVLMLNQWWMLAPGGAIFVTVIAFNLLGDVLRDVVDPRLRL